MGEMSESVFKTIICLGQSSVLPMHESDFSNAGLFWNETVSNATVIALVLLYICFNAAYELPYKQEIHQEMR